MSAVRVVREYIRVDIVLRAVSAPLRIALSEQPALKQKVKILFIYPIFIKMIRQSYTAHETHLLLKKIKEHADCVCSRRAPCSYYMRLPRKKSRGFALF